jgi:hypothetical protein
MIIIQKEGDDDQSEGSGATKMRTNRTGENHDQSERGK